MRLNEFISEEEWLQLQKKRSLLPKAGDLLIETFPRAGRHYLVAYPFEGRLVHQTLGMLLTRRMERMGLKPLGFVATDYVLATWSAKAPYDVARLFEEDMLGDDLEGESREVGRAHAELAAALHRLTLDLEIERSASMPMEGKGVYARWDGDENTLTFWTSTQTSTSARAAIAARAVPLSTQTKANVTPSSSS